LHRKELKNAREIRAIFMRRTAFTEGKKNEKLRMKKLKENKEKLFKRNEDQITCRKVMGCEEHVKKKEKKNQTRKKEKKMMKKKSNEM
jgi:hypothetical protein